MFTLFVQQMHLFRIIVYIMAYQRIKAINYPRSLYKVSNKFCAKLLETFTYIQLMLSDIFYYLLFKIYII